MALLSSCFFVILWRETKPYYEISTDVISYTCGKRRALWVDGDGYGYAHPLHPCGTIRRSLVRRTRAHTTDSLQRIHFQHALTPASQPHSSPALPRLDHRALLYLADRDGHVGLVAAC